jgi:acetyltransferase-like isoleucine patch superfamily enzyme
MKLWLKRVAALRSLLSIIWRRERLRWRGARIGSLSVISPARIEGKVRLLSIGKCTFVGRTEVALHDTVAIGDFVVINDNVTILTGTHSIDDSAWGLITKPIEVCDYAWIGQGAMILPGVVVGRGAVVGAGAVVAESVEPFSVMVGNPARPLSRKRPQILNYVPVGNIAAFRAWLGTNSLLPSKGSQ